MEPNNRTTYTVTEFLITGLDEVQHPKLVGAAILFVLFLILIGSITNICVIAFNKPLHTPMYFFICSLAMVDIVYTSGISVTMLNVLLGEERRVPYAPSLIFFSYMKIVHVVIHMSSSKDRRKTFSTCVSHMIVVACFFIPKVLLMRFEGA
ncbi:olfactory receptor 13G1-like [Salvelinus fontinalis]|uniref:olfactory receptor 13G1-like n=1 Tax=Salvelinus fontinalis TaxID=8038 RepID=UPI002485E757|nr:olfactory receptor 13G1-like [Salvelinus fontinalis]